MINTLHFDNWSQHFQGRVPQHRRLETMDKHSKMHSKTVRQQQRH